MDNSIDPGTNSQVPANDVNLFLIIVPFLTETNLENDFDKLKDEIEFVDQDDLKAGISVFLGAYSKN